MTTSLHPWGWDEDLERALQALAEPRLVPARVVLEQPRTLHLVTPFGEVVATTSGRLRHNARLRSELPAVGDWVAYRPATGGRTIATVEAVLPRRSKLSRKVAGARTDEQVVAANVDRVFLVMGLDGDYNPRRVERFLLMIHHAGVAATIVLNKLDLTADASAVLAELHDVAADTPVVAISCRDSQHIELLTPWLTPRHTIALVGSSGVGKSTLINRLLGEDRLATGDVRDRDDRGQHTTRHRELVRLPGGAILVDNPGIRELQPWVDDSSVEDAFEDIAELASRCRFADCTHGNEPGCQVQAAISSGELDPARLHNRRTLGAEVAALGVRQKGLAAQRARKTLASVHKANDRYRPRK